ncbi:MAG: DUF1957 domain-containing protein [Planctomycetes bacterium]|nr:DUF1957 domain-containing protein [Planctomycetota bacterium]
MPGGYFMLVLHAHLPYVRHPEQARFLEEDWLFEAITETYVPLLSMLENVSRHGARNVLTLSFSPPLAEMLADPMLTGRYLSHLDRLIALAGREVDEKRNTPFFDAAVMYLDTFRRCRSVVVDIWGGNILNAFRRLDAQGVIELMTCAGTHPVMPLVSEDSNILAHLELSQRNFHKHFGRGSAGVWMPECAYREASGDLPPLSVLLAEKGFRYTFIETHGIMYGEPRPAYGVYRPVYGPGGVAFFGRDVETSHQVWSRSQGYPGDGLYREFYRDLGYDGDYDSVRPVLHDDGVRRNIGIKYFRITRNDADLGAKEPYMPRPADEKAAEHAGNFMFNRQQQVAYLTGVLQTTPVITAMYDAELFGHWWYEGPRFLEYLFLKLHYDQNEVETITPSAYLDAYPEHQLLEPATSTWGGGGYFETWVNDETGWIYRHLHTAERRMKELASRLPHPDAFTRRALNQAARELVLMQSSDWPFLITTGTAKPYAVKRLKEHIHNFNRLFCELLSGSVDAGWLAWLEEKDHIFFEEMDYAVFAG